MSKRKSIEKVTAFVTRNEDSRPELLVFRHPKAGVQVPAGTVELGESAERAALRELAEESGLSDVRIVSHLGQMSRALPDDERVIVRMTKIFNAPAYDASSEGYGLTRGSPVKVGAEIEGFTEICCEALDWNHRPPVRVFEVSGYVRTSLLASHVNRHLFHLATVKPTPDSWSVAADGLVFELYWTPLVPRPNLNRWQNGWLEQVYEELRASAQVEE